MIKVDENYLTLLLQGDLKRRGYYHGNLDNIHGPKTKAALILFHEEFLPGDGTFDWTARFYGDDILVEDVSVTWFGGANDPLDNGETASGVSTRANPKFFGCALAVVPGHPSTSGSPLTVGEGLRPAIPWHTQVLFERAGQSVLCSLIDNGPARSAGDAGDLTLPAFKALGGTRIQGVLDHVTIRIPGGAAYLRQE